MWTSSGRHECDHLQDGKNVAIFRAARMWPSSGQKEYGHIQGGKNKNAATLKMAT
jgi:hypothetical protein